MDDTLPVGLVEVAKKPYSVLKEFIEGLTLDHALCLFITFSQLKIAIQVDDKVRIAFPDRIFWFSIDGQTLTVVGCSVQQIMGLRQS